MPTSVSGASLNHHIHTGPGERVGPSQGHRSSIRVPLGLRISTPFNVRNNGFDFPISPVTNVSCEDVLADNWPPILPIFGYNPARGYGGRYMGPEADQPLIPQNNKAGQHAQRRRPHNPPAEFESADRRTNLSYQP